MKLWSKVSILIGAVVIIGLFLRLFSFSQVPYSLYWDEAAILLDAKVLAATGHDMHGGPWSQLIFPSYGDYKLPVYIWLAALAVKALGVSAFAVRLPSLLAGLLTLPAIYLVALGIGKLYKSANAKVFAWSSVVVALLSPWAVGFSRTGFESHVAQAFLAWSIVVWVYGVLLSGKKITSPWFWLSVLGSSLLGLLAAYTYFALRFVWPVIIASSFILPSLFGKESKTNIIRLSAAVVVALVLGFVGFYPMTHSPLYAESTRLRLGTASLLNTDSFTLESNVRREIAGNTIVDRVFFHRWLLMGEGLLQNYAKNFSWEYIFMTGDANLRHSTGVFGLFLLPFAVLPFVGLVRIRGAWWRPAAWLFLWWLAAVLPAAIPLNTPHALRSLSGLVPASLLFGGCLAFAYNEFLRTRSYIFRFVSFAWCTWLAISVFAFGWYYFNAYPKISSPDWQHGYHELARAVAENHQQFNHPVVVTGFDDRFFLWQLALPSVAAQDTAGMTHNQYRIISTGSEGIWFDEIPQIKDWAASQRSFAMAGTPGQFEEWQKKYNIRFTVTHSITSPQGETLYQVANADTTTQPNP